MRLGAAGSARPLLPSRELVAEIETVRGEKDAAIRRRAREAAAGWRDRERELTEQARRTVEQRQDEVVNEIRGHLGLTRE